jgi:hypothetical protein
MATTNLVSVTEYLSTSYRPDCDYVDGDGVGGEHDDRVQHGVADRAGDAD